MEKFEEVAGFRNTLELTDFQDSRRLKPKGRWNEDIFENDHPIVCELACGKGSYTLELARRNPHINFVGIDIKGDRIWRGAKEALEQNLENVRFMRMYIDHLDEYFSPGEISSAWITFPDPYPRRPDRSNRLTSAKFLNIYHKVFVPGAHLHLKTDSKSLFEFSKSSVAKFGCKIHEVVDDIYAECPDSEVLTIKTYYEKRWLEKGKNIKYLHFSLPEQN